MAAQAARRGGNLAEASRFVAAAKSAGATEEAVQFERELALVQSGRHPRADDYLQACERRPDIPESRLIAEALIVGSLSKMDLATAKRVLNLWETRIREEIPLSPADRIQGTIWRAEVSLRAGDIDSAIARLKEALQADSDNDQTRLRLAELLVRQAPREALTHLDLLSAEGGDDRGADLTRVRALRALGEHEAAATIIDRLATQFAGDQEILLERGLVALDLLKADAALGWLRQAERAGAERRDVNIALARALQLNGQQEEAARYREKVSALDAKLLKRPSASETPEQNPP